MDKYTVTINAGPLSADDNVVYFVNGDVSITLEIQSYTDANGNETDHLQKWVEFVPNNGRQRGQLHKVPFERLVKITQAEE